jgi:hypothetical protein
MSLRKKWLKKRANKGFVAAMGCTRTNNPWDKEKK